eukprot:767305-Hanusia_phi.AAC.10
MKQEVSLCDSLTGFVIPIQMPDGRKLNVAIEEVIDPSFCKVSPSELHTNSTRSSAISPSTRLLSTAMKLPPNLAETERQKVEAVNNLLVKRDEQPPPE